MRFWFHNHKWHTTWTKPSTAWFVDRGRKFTFKSQTRRQDCKGCNKYRVEYIGPYGDWQTSAGEW